MTPSLPDAETLYAGAYTMYRMRPRQLAGTAERRARELIVPRLPIDADAHYERRVPADPSASLDTVAGNTAAIRRALAGETRDRYRTRAREAARGTPQLLGRSVPVVQDGTVRWDANALREASPMWALKFWSFDPLEWLVLGVDPGVAAGDDATGEPAPDDHAARRRGDGDHAAPKLRDIFDGWIADWIDTIDVGGRRYLRRCWTPWSVSLRIQRWCRYLAWRRDTAAAGPGASDGRSDPEFDRALRREIYKNALFLRNHVERDVGGNHLIENGAALVVAGVVFEDAATDWLETGVSILQAAADRQFLADGAHFERSPMYHLEVLTRYLTAWDLLERAGRPVPDRIVRTATAATRFLRWLRPPDGRIPLLNDSVYEVALPLSDCLRYADAVGVDPVGTDGGRVTLDAPTTGRDGAIDTAADLTWLRTDVGSMLVDGGPVGPPHLPGHAHSDTLQVLLWVGDHPVVTDTGTYDYVPGPRRQSARGVRGHNTVQVGATEPITLAGKYLMGPRPTPRTRTVDGPVSLVEGRYEARPFGGPAYTHHRAVFAGADWWLVTDVVAGDVDGATVRARYHLHPDVTPTPPAASGGASEPDVARLRTGGDTPDVRLEALAGTLDHGTSEYHPRFGEAIERPMLHLTVDDARRARLATLVTRADADGATLEMDDAGVEPRSLHIGGDTHELPVVALSPAAARGPES